MKKWLLILLVACYGLSATGATIQLHYCCGKLKKVSWGLSAEKSCGMQHKMGDKPCCENKLISAKDDSQQNDHYTVQLSPQTSVAGAPMFPVSDHAIPLATADHFLPNATAPPLPEDRCVLFCVFRI